MRTPRRGKGALPRFLSAVAEPSATLRARTRQTRYAHPHRPQVHVPRTSRRAPTSLPPPAAFSAPGADGGARGRGRRGGSGGPADLPGSGGGVHPRHAPGSRGGGPRGRRSVRQLPGAGTGASGANGGEPERPSQKTIAEGWVNLLRAGVLLLLLGPGRPGRPRAEPDGGGSCAQAAERGAGGGGRPGVRGGGGAERGHPRRPADCDAEPRRARCRGHAVPALVRRVHGESVRLPGGRRTGGDGVQLRAEALELELFLASRAVSHRCTCATRSVSSMTSFHAAEPPEVSQKRDAGPVLRSWRCCTRRRGPRCSSTPAPST